MFVEMIFEQLRQHADITGLTLKQRTQEAFSSISVRVPNNLTQFIAHYRFTVITSPEKQSLKNSEVTCGGKPSRHLPHRTRWRFRTALYIVERQ